MILNNYKCIIMLLLIFCAVETNCKKRKIKRKCCENPPVVIHFNSGYIAIPNLFTPDSDGSDDILIVYSTGIKEFKFTVRNSIGAKVFETTDPGKYWNGLYKGKVREGVFKYKIEAVTNDGEKIEKESKICSIMFRSTNNNFCIEEADNCIFGNQWDGNSFGYTIQEPPHFKCK